MFADTALGARMAEAGELCHREIVARMSELANESDVHELAQRAVEIQRRHVESVRDASLTLAAEEAGSPTSA